MRLIFETLLQPPTAVEAHRKTDRFLLCSRWTVFLFVCLMSWALCLKKKDKKHFMLDFFILHLYYFVICFMPLNEFAFAVKVFCEIICLSKAVKAKQDDEHHECGCYK